MFLYVNLSIIPNDDTLSISANYLIIYLIYIANEAKFYDE